MSPHQWARGKCPASSARETVGAHNHVALLFAVADQASLSADLSSDVIVGQACGREERNLLAPSNGVHGVDGGYAGLNHLFRICAFCRIDGGSSDVQKGLSQDCWPADKCTQSVYSSWSSDVS